MTDYSYPCSNIAITIKQDATEVTAAVGQGGTLTLDFDVSELFGNSKVTRASKWVDAIHVGIAVAHAEFDGKVMGLLLGETSADIDVEGSSKSGYTRASILAAYVPVDFDVKGIFKDKDDNEFAFKVSGVVFANLTIPWGTEGFIRRNLRGNGDELFLHYKTPA